MRWFPAWKSRAAGSRQPSASATNRSAGPRIRPGGAVPGEEEADDRGTRDHDAAGRQEGDREHRRAARGPGEERAQAEQQLEGAEGEGRPLPLPYAEQPAQRVADQPEREPRREHLGVAARLQPLTAQHQREQLRPRDPDCQVGGEARGEESQCRALGEPAQLLRLRRQPGGAGEEYLAHRLGHQHGGQHQQLEAEGVESRRGGAEGGREDDRGELEAPDVEEAGPGGEQGEAPVAGRDLPDARPGRPLRRPGAPGGERQAAHSGHASDHVAHDEPERAGAAEAETDLRRGLPDALAQPGACQPAELALPDGPVGERLIGAGREERDRDHPEIGPEGGDVHRRNERASQEPDEEGDDRSGGQHDPEGKHQQRPGRRFLPRERDRRLVPERGDHHQHRKDRGIDREDAVLCRRIESGEGRDRERQEQLCDGRARGQRQHTANEPSTRRFRARVR